LKLSRNHSASECENNLPYDSARNRMGEFVTTHDAIADIIRESLSVKQAILNDSGLIQTIAMLGEEMSRALPDDNCNCQLLDRKEPLHSLTVEDLTGIQGTLRVHGFHMYAEELASILTHAAHLAYDLPVLAIQKPDMVISEV